MKILILLPRQLGDILLGLPIAHALKLHFGSDVSVHWYAHPMGKLILENHPWIDKAHYYPSGIIKEQKFVFKMRLEKFDVVIDAMANPRTALLSYLTGAKQRISFRTRINRNWAYTTLVPRELLNNGYVGQTRLELLRPLGIDPSVMSFMPTLIATQSEKTKVDIWLKEQGLGGKKWVAISPTHRHGVRKWSGESFVSLAKKIIAEHKFHIVWLWGPGEEDEVMSIHTSLQDNHHSHVVPLFNLRETAELCSHAQVFVGNSNGLSHVAAAGGCKTLVLHGPTAPKSWTPPDKTRHMGLQRLEGCVSCQSNVCKLSERECLVRLEVGSVLKSFALLTDT